MGSSHAQLAAQIRHKSVNELIQFLYPEQADLKAFPADQKIESHDFKVYATIQKKDPPVAELNADEYAFDLARSELNSTSAEIVMGKQKAPQNNKADEFFQKACVLIFARLVNKLMAGQKLNAEDIKYLDFFRCPAAPFHNMRVNYAFFQVVWQKIINNPHNFYGRQQVKVLFAEYLDLQLTEDNHATPAHKTLKTLIEDKRGQLAGLIDFVCDEKDFLRTEVKDEKGQVAHAFKIEGEDSNGIANKHAHVYALELALNELNDKYAEAIYQKRTLSTKESRANAYFQKACIIIFVKILKKLISRELLTNEDLEQLSYLAKPFHGFNVNANNLKGIWKRVHPLIKDQPHILHIESFFSQHIGIGLYSQNDRKADKQVFSQINSWQQIGNEALPFSPRINILNQLFSEANKLNVVHVDKPRTAQLKSVRVNLEAGIKARLATFQTLESKVEYLLVCIDLPAVHLTRTGAAGKSETARKFCETILSYLQIIEAQIASFESNNKNRMQGEINSRFQNGSNAERMVTVTQYYYKLEAFAKLLEHVRINKIFQLPHRGRKANSIRNSEMHQQAEILKGRNERKITIIRDKAPALVLPEKTGPAPRHEYQSLRPLIRFTRKVSGDESHHGDDQKFSFTP